MHNPLVSIVIPIYKVEPYVERCINSVLRQTYRKLEIILVNDCTPDCSMELAEKCIEKSPLSRDISFIFLKHDENCGLSAARNTGIQTASGEYIYFLDSDDEISGNCIENLVNPLRKKSYNFVVGYYQTIGNDNLPQQTVQGEVLGVNNIAKEYCYDHWHCMAWNKLVNRQFLIDNMLFFQDGLIHEDELWSAQLACTAESMYAVPVPTYVYYIRENSITTMENIARKTYFYKMILKSFYEFQETRSLYFKEIEDINVKIKNYIYNMMTMQNYSSLKIYSALRQCDVRSIKMKNKLYNSVKEKFLNFDQYLPSTLGYIYMIAINKLWSLK